MLWIDLKLPNCFKPVWPVSCQTHFKAVWPVYAMDNVILYWADMYPYTVASILPSVYLECLSRKIRKQASEQSNRCACTVAVQGHVNSVQLCYGVVMACVNSSMHVLVLQL